MSECLKVEDLGKSFISETSRVEVLKSITFTLDFGKTVAIVGQSGSGKSTLLQILGALMRPTTGHVRFKGEDVFEYDERALNHYRNTQIGFIFQFHHLLPDFSAIENVAMPLFIRGGEDSPQASRIAEACLSQVGLSHRTAHQPYALSGGEQQRVAIARAVAGSPNLILADEPTGNLDPKNAVEVSELLFDLARRQRIGLIIATHNMDIAAKTDRLYKLIEGRLEEQR